jgi:hypothetical protein
MIERCEVAALNTDSKFWCSREKGHDDVMLMAEVLAMTYVEGS